MTAQERDFDLVVFGATGFVGRRTVRQLQRRAPTTLRWAVAGRDRARLEQLAAEVPIFVVDVNDRDNMSAVVARTHVVLNLAGPFRRLGDPVVAACIENATHYCDISGETARVRDLVDRYDDAAQRAGVKIVCFGGVSSTPADLAVLLLEQQLNGELQEVAAVVRLKSGLFSGGTIASMCAAVESGDALRERNPFLLGPSSRHPTVEECDPVGVRYDRSHRAWLTRSPLGISDTRALRLSSTLRGSDITVQEYLAFDGRLGVFAALFVRATFNLINLALRTPFGRKALTQLVPPGRGPSERQITRGRYCLNVTGTNRTGQRAHLSISFDGDPGNHVTAVCATAIALILATGDMALPTAGGVLTPSTAIGINLTAALVDSGMRIHFDECVADTLPRS